MNAISQITKSLLVGLALVSICGAEGSSRSPSDQDLANIEFQQNLGSRIDLDLSFIDERGHETRLRNYFGEKPVILVLGYYECPMLCTLVMNGMIESLEDLKWTIGKEFEVVNISIDPRETPGLAAAKKNSYLKRYGRAGASDGWHFLTGREPEIRTIAREVGFNYIYDPATRQYAHPSGLVFLSPDGTIVRYQFGVVFKPGDVLSNLQQARAGQPGSAVQKLVFLCFHYNPIQGKYGPLIMLSLRIMAVLMILGLVVAILAALKRHKSNPSPATAPSAENGGSGP